MMRIIKVQMRGGLEQKGSAVGIQLCLYEQSLNCSMIVSYVCDP